MIEIKNKKSYNGQGEYVGRPTILGNPFSYLKNTKAKFQTKDRDEAVEKYKDFFNQELITNPSFKNEVDKLILKYKKEKALTLICWCAPLRCHCDVIKEYILKITNDNKE